MKRILSAGIKHSYVCLFLSATLLILSTTLTFSQSIPETARNFFFDRAGLKSAAVSQEEIVLRYQSTEEVKTPVSVYQSSQKGFVVISGNDEKHFISGYSPTGDFRKDEIPEALRALIYSYEASEISEYDESVRLKSTTEILPLLDKAGIHLDQYHHDEAGGCPSGCVATAFAQIMLYHKYPDKGVGSHCYTDPKHGELCADFGGTVFDWNNMNDEAYKKLSFQLGVAMEMAYCGSENGSYPLDPDYMQVLARNFKYYVHSGSNEPFYIINELEKERPVYVELYGEIAHSVIVDGLDHEGRFHINWGWGGDYNGYYMLYSEPIEVGVLVFGSQIRNTLFISTTPFEIERQDSLALLAINESFGGQLGWDISRPVANWPGVLVMNGRVNELSLQLDREHEGWIPVEIGDLSALREFHLTGKIHGAIPESLYSLQQLEELIIQAEYGSTLYGELSSQIGNLTKLQTLRLNGFLQGTIPNSIGNLNQLIELNLMHNHLTGIIPEDLGNLSNLLIFSLNDNQLTGSIPTSVGNLINLISFDVYMNQLTGVVPSAIGNLTKLGSLELNNNQFEGEFPSSIKNLTDLWSLNLSNNKFTAIPNEIGCLKNLTSLYFNNNELTAIPDSIVLIRGLKSFSARSNKISYLPPDFGAWPDLIQVDVSDNLIVEFPKELCFLQKLESVNFEKHKITTVPLSMEYMNPEVVINLRNNEISVILADNILSLENVNLAVNRLTFEDVPISNELKSGFSTQKNVLLKDSLFKARAGETLTVDIREITGMNHPGNEYYWFKYPENKDDNYKNDNDYKIESPVLSITVDETNLGDRYYCKIFNETILSYQRLFYGELIEGPVLRVLNTDAITIEPMNDIEALELEYPEGFVLTSGEVNNGTVADREVILASPFGTRGDIIW